MVAPLFIPPILMAGASAQNYIINGSALFDGATGYLSRTPSVVGNRRTFVLEALVKLNDISANQHFFMAGDGANDYFYLQFHNASNQLTLFDRSGGTNHISLTTTALLRDPSAWYHIVASVDTTQVTASDRAKIWINGTQITSFSSSTYPSQNHNCVWNKADIHQLGSFRNPSVYNHHSVARATHYDSLAITDPASAGMGENTPDGYWRIKDVSALKGKLWQTETLNSIHQVMGNISNVIIQSGNGTLDGGDGATEPTILVRQSFKGDFSVTATHDSTTTKMLNVAIGKKSFWASNFDDDATLGGLDLAARTAGEGFSIQLANTSPPFVQTSTDNYYGSNLAAGHTVTVERVGSTFNLYQNGSFIATIVTGLENEEVQICFTVAGGVSTYNFDHSNIAWSWEAAEETNVFTGGITDSDGLRSIDPTGFTRIGNMTLNGGLNAGFDGNQYSTIANSPAVPTNSTDATIGLDFTTARVVRGVYVSTTQDGGLYSNTNTDHTCSLQGSDDNSVWNTVATAEIADRINTTGYINAETNTTAYRYWRVLISWESIPGNLKVSDIEFHEALAETVNSNGFLLEGQDVANGIDISRDDLTTKSKLSRQWGGSTSNYTFSDGGLVGSTLQRAINSTASFVGDFEIQFTGVSSTGGGDGICFGVYETAEDGSFSATNTSGNMFGMMNSFWFAVSGACYYGGAIEASPGFTYGAIYELTRSGNMVRLYQNGVLHHTWVGTSSNPVRIAIGTGGSLEIKNLVWADGTTLSNVFFVSGTITATNDSPTDSASQKNTYFATLNPDIPGSQVTLSEGNMRSLHGPDDAAALTLPLVDGIDMAVEIELVTNPGVNVAGVALLTRDALYAITNWGLVNVFGHNAGEYAWQSNGTIRSNGVSTTSAAAYTSGDIIGIRRDANGNIIFYKNGLPTGGNPSYTGIAGDLTAIVVNNASSTSGSAFRIRTNPDDWTYSYGDAVGVSTTTTGVGLYPTFVDTANSVLQLTRNANGTIQLHSNGSGLNLRGKTLGTLGVNQGKVYIEAQWKQIAGIGNQTWFGFARSGSESLRDYTLGTIGFLAADVVALWMAENNAWRTYADGASTIGSNNNNNDHYALAVDFDAGKVWGKNLTQDATWLGGASDADVAAGISPTHTFTAGDTWVPIGMATWGSLGANQGDVVCNFGVDPTSFQGTPPMGFSGPNSATHVSTSSVDPSEHADVLLYKGKRNKGGNGGGRNGVNAGGGGQGGGASSVQKNGTVMALAAGGGGGGGGGFTGSSPAGGAGGAGNGAGGAAGVLNGGPGISSSNGGGGGGGGGSQANDGMGGGTTPGGGGNGGSNILHASTTATTNSLGTGTIPPNIGDVDYTGSVGVGGVASGGGVGGILDTGETGLVVVEFLVSGTKTTYNAEPRYYVNVPAGEMSVRVKCWGGGGSSGGDSTAYAGGNGGAGGFVQAEFDVAPGDVLTITVGEGGGLAADTDLEPFKFQPDFALFMERTHTSSHTLFTSTIGAGQYIRPDTVDGLTAFDSTQLSAFLPGGVRIGASNGINEIDQDYLLLCLKAGGSAVANNEGTIAAQVSANPALGFSIVTTTGTGANGTIGHGLGKRPGLIIAKRLDAGNGWSVYHKDVGATQYLELHDTTTPFTNSTIWNDMEPSSSVFSVGTHGTTNVLNGSYVFYCFAETDIIKIGSYTGNGVADGPFQYLGGHPLATITKRIDAGGSGWNFHNAVSSPRNPVEDYLQLNTSAAEGTSSGLAIDMTSIGRKMRGTSVGINTNGGTYIYLAILDQLIQGGVSQVDQGRGR